MLWSNKNYLIKTIGLSRHSYTYYVLYNDNIIEHT